MTIDTLTRRIDALLKMIELRQLFHGLPYIVYGPDGVTLPAYQEIEQQALERNLPIKAYGFDPNEDGIEL